MNEWMKNSPDSDLNVQILQIMYSHVVPVKLWCNLDRYVSIFNGHHLYVWTLRALLLPLACSRSLHHSFLDPNVSAHKSQIQSSVHYSGGSQQAGDGNQWEVDWELRSVQDQAMGLVLVENVQDLLTQHSSHRVHRGPFLSPHSLMAPALS